MDPWDLFNLEDIYKQWKNVGKMLDKEEELLAELQKEENKSNKRKSISRDHAGAHQRLVADYFDDSCTYTEIQKTISNEEATVSQNWKLGLTPIQKCTAFMRMLAYGGAADACDEYVKMGTTIALECISTFCEDVISLFQEEYLRRTNGEDLQRLLQVGQDHGFPRMIRSIDCMHWQWKNCPKAWQGQFTSRHKGTSTVILEAVASYDLWIWHAVFGMHGTLNDINVLDRSPVFDDIKSGKALSVNYTVNSRPYNLAYYLADGIYPKWPVFIKSIRMPQGNKHQLFSNHPEACRKDVERAFGVLQARFVIVREPARMWDLEVLGKIMRACIILHNMIVEDKRDSYSRNWENINLELSDNVGPSSSSLNFETQVHPQFEVHIQGRTGMSTHTRAGVRDKAQHIQLKKDLVEHIWNKFGTTLD